MRGSPLILLEKDRGYVGVTKNQEQIEMKNN